MTWDFCLTSTDLFMGRSSSSVYLITRQIFNYEQILWGRSLKNSHHSDDHKGNSIHAGIRPGVRVWVRQILQWLFYTVPSMDLAIDYHRLLPGNLAYTYLFPWICCMLFISLFHSLCCMLSKKWEDAIIQLHAHPVHGLLLRYCSALFSDAMTQDYALTITYICRGAHIISCLYHSLMNYSVNKNHHSDQPKKVCRSLSQIMATLQNHRDFYYHNA